MPKNSPEKSKGKGKEPAGSPSTDFANLTISIPRSLEGYIEAKKTESPNRLLPLFYPTYLPGLATDGKVINFIATPDEIRETRIRLYKEFLESSGESVKSDPVDLYIAVFAARERVVAWLGLLAELPSIQEAGRIARNATEFKEYVTGLTEDLGRLKIYCKLYALNVTSADERVLYKNIYLSLASIAARYQRGTREKDYDVRVSDSLPECINETILNQYVGNLRKIGCDRSQGWYVDPSGNKQELFSYGRLDSSRLIGMRSSGKAVTGLVAVRFLEEYRKSGLGGTASLAQLLDTPVVSLCPLLRSEVENRHKKGSAARTKWNQITIRHLLNNTSGLPNPEEVTRTETFSEALKQRPRAVGVKFLYCNNGFDIVNFALQELITSSPGKVLGAHSLQEFTQKVMGDRWYAPTGTIPPTATSGNLEIPQGRGMACATAEPWSTLFEVLGNQDAKIVSEILNPFAKENGKARDKVERYGSGFWLKDYGLCTNGYQQNYSYLILKEKRRSDESHAKWVTRDLNNGYIVLVQQSDAPHMTADFAPQASQELEALRSKLFR